MKYNLNKEQFCDFINIASGLFNPLTGFMTEKDYRSVVEEMMLINGEIWTIPITLDVDEDTYKMAFKKSNINCFYENDFIGYIEVESCFKITPENDFRKVFNTVDSNHPGVFFELQRSPYRVGGKVKLIKENLLNNFLNPEKVRKTFKNKNWETIAGFQTRNPIHRAHEHLQRVALEICDGLFINPLIGWKKKGDFSEDAVISGYKAMIENYYPEERIYFEPLMTPMRYAGPREAIFHAIIRRNCGCTHFIIGRDHAGVGDYYGKYEAHKLANEIQKEDKLGIELLLFKGPYFCLKCNQIVTEKTCKHPKNFQIEISGTLIREFLINKKKLDEKFMRKEVAEAILALGDKIFIK